MPSPNKHLILVSLSIAIIGFAYCWYTTYPLKFDKSIWREARHSQDLHMLYRMSEDLDAQISNGLIKTSRDALDLLGAEGGPFTF